MDLRKQYVQCARGLFISFLGREKENIGRIAKYLHERRLISSGQNDIITSNLRDGFPEEAAGSLPEHAFQYDPKEWTQNILSALSETAPEDGSLLMLLGSLFSSPRISEDIIFLMNHQAALPAQYGEIASFEKKAWPRLESHSLQGSSSELQLDNPRHGHETRSITMREWHAEILSRCFAEDGQPHVKEFIEDLKWLFSGKKPDGREKNTSEPRSSVNCQQQNMLMMPKAGEILELKHSDVSHGGIELRVVLVEGIVDRCNKLFASFRVNDQWSLCHMDMMPCGDIYFCHVPQARSSSMIDYRYGLKTSSGEIRWEEFPSLGKHNSVRTIFVQDFKMTNIVQDIATFPHRHSQNKRFKFSCQDLMAYHLTAAEHSLLQLSDRQKYCQNLNAWLNQIKHGWRFTNAQESPISIHSKEAQHILLSWYGKLVHKVQKQSGDDQVIITALGVVVELYLTKTTVVHQELLAHLFQCLSIHQLNEEKQNSLQNKIFQRSKSLVGGSIEIVCDAFHALYKQLSYHPVPNFLLSLPLYWSLSRMDTSAFDVTDSQVNSEFLLVKSGLPRSLKLRDIKQSFQSSSAQSSLLRLAPSICTIAKFCPVIVGSYQFLLEDKNLLEMIKNKDENIIKCHFPLDAIFFQLLNACTGRQSRVDIPDVMMLNEYFVERFKIETKKAKKVTKQKEKSQALKSIKMSENIISLVSGLFMDITQKTNTSQQQVHSTNQCILWCLNITRLAAALTLTLASARGDCQFVLTKIVDDVVAMAVAVSNWIHKCKLDTRQIQFLNSVVSVEWPDEKLLTKWKEIMKAEVKDKISKAWHQRKDEEFLDFYATTLEKIHLEETVESCLSEKAFLCTGNILSTYSFDSKTKKDRSSKTYASVVYKNIVSWIKKPRFISIFDRLFQKEFQKAVTFYPDNPSMQSLTLLLSWSFSLQFYELFYNDSALDKFSDKTQDQITLVADVFGEVVQRLKSGDILIMQLQQIIEHSEKFIELCKCIKSLQWTVDLSEQGLPQMIGKRHQQLLAFETATEHIRGFLQACSKLEEGGECMVKTTDLKEKLRDSANVGNKVLSKFCPDQDESRTTKSFLNLSADVLKKFEAISSLKDSKVFQEMFHQSALNVKAASEGYGCDLGDSGLWHVSWREVIEKIWKETFNDIMSLVLEIDEGVLGLETAKEWFQRCSGDPDEIRKEVKILYEYYQSASGTSNETEAPVRRKAKQYDDEYSESDEYDSDDDSVPSEQDLDSEYSDDMETYETVTNMNLRAAQLASFFMLEKAEETIQIILEIRDVLNISGDFSTLERLQAGAISGGNLNSLPNELEVPTVCTISEEKISCLKCFIKERQLILWLREEMTNIGEVQVMCDLAMISAGETPYEVDIVSCLLGAVMGFAPLIFDVDEEDGFDELLVKCSAVWKNMETDGKLLEKWSDAGKQLAWFRNIGNARGSVEKQSLSLAREINQSGVYRIEGKNLGGAVSYKDCVSLTLVNEAGLQENYNLDNLFDLQCKLMLIAGEAEAGWNDVSNFVNILEIVRNVAETFVKLVHAGCMLFNQWSALIRCNNVKLDKNDALSLEIKFGQTCHPLKGNISVTELSQLCHILNESLNRWKAYVDEMRMKYYFLNTYSMLQIIYLCHELAVHGNKIPDQVNTLLSFVGESTSGLDLHELLNEAMKAEIEQSSTTADQGGLGKEDKISIVRRVMAEEDVFENVAKAAVQAEYGQDKPDYFNWILLNQFEEDEIERLCADFNKESETFHQKSKERKIVSILYNRSASTLEEVISRLQDRESSASVMDSVAAVCKGYHDETTTITLEDSLSIQHLGRFLNLFNQKHSKSKVNRSLIEPFVKGRPNLLMCHEHEILHSLLYLYMVDEKEPLPTTFEVLLCSEMTTIDEVERFMRRAMCKNEGHDKLLFTLAFADKLDFNVSTATEKIFNLLTSVTKNSDYQLVVLLSKPQHYLTTCFDKYLISEGKWMTSSLDIARYLSENLKLPQDSIKSSATCADNDATTVKIIASMQSGVGKSLYVQRSHEKLCNNTMALKTTIRLLERSIETDYVIERLLRPFQGHSRNHKALLVHIDLTPAVHKGIEAFFFNLLVLGSIQNSGGYVWKKDPNHLYMIEVTRGDHLQKERFSPHHILRLLPCIMCSPPRKVLENLQSDEHVEFVGMDEKEFLSETYQRPWQYLHMYDNKQQNPRVLDVFKYKKPAGTDKDCLEILLKHCCMHDPSWAQLRHFASFLNVQLRNCENSIFCNPLIVGVELSGLRSFAIEFMIRMSRDFATPSLVISDESSPRQDVEDLSVYQFRRKWEESSHPYLFFNDDGNTMTFINVNISDEGDLLDKNGEIKEERIITKHLVQGLKGQGVSLDLNFDTLSRTEKLAKLCQVMGISKVFDPDPTYKLTTDNVLKILAVYMRFRCQIPVIIMGETGCGKTRMVEFISKLKAGNKQSHTQSMVTLKIHGGITVHDIYRSVQNACDISMRNSNSARFGTILFYDEANTTEAIYALKEVMCDITVDGESFRQSDIKLVAACNPYKQLSAEAIKKLEDSGLGYRIKTCDTSHLFGNVPIRTLVYRVVALPPSMQPFVWDFGQLNSAAERIYIQQMTKRLGDKLGLDRESMTILNAILCEAQRYMRSRPDECRYVSLRDVERCVIVYEWFHRHRETIYPEIEKEIHRRYARMQQQPPETSDELRTLLQTIGVCYHASLEDRRRFLEAISYTFGLEGLYVPELHIHEEIQAAQSVFLQNMKMEDNIALNEALQENAFMMTVCADMKIPLFVIGKPGTSKSLAKTIVGDNLRGMLSHTSLCKQLKQIHIISYQCSALTDAAGIETVFKQCSQLQAKQDQNSYSAVVVLDEIGLAEDSPNMPLKILHPLLEGSGTGTDNLSKQNPSHRVGFIGISNWALDPAKMNRGIFVTRSKPSKDDLKKTAKGIFRNQKNKINENLELLEKMTESYMRIYENQEVEYFGLRDYYSLIKMLHRKCISAESTLTVDDVTMAIHRNFSGGKMSYFEIFRRSIQHLYKDLLSPTVPLRKVISDNLREKESRYLLLLTNQFSAASLLQLCIENSTNQIQIIFGSSFPGDHQYTDICRNINKIKAYMETGKPVVLLNMTEIHESLYDALNQHYVTFGGQRYVDLGLGGHRVKCRVAPEFRLIVVEQKEVVYTQYPIPLINRLEKHHLDSKSLLSDDQIAIAASLEHWVEKFIRIGSWDFKGKDAFMGYHSDTVCSVVLSTGTINEDTLQKILLDSVSMDAIFRLGEAQIGGQCEEIQSFYLQHQCHDDLMSLLRETLLSKGESLLEVVSYSNVLSEIDRLYIERQFGEDAFVMLLSLEQFETEREYNIKLNQFFEYAKSNDCTTKVLLIQCAQAQSHGQLVECAKFTLKNKLKEYSSKFDLKNMIIAILLSTEREGDKSMILSSLSLQHSPDNRIVYIDELRTAKSAIQPASMFFNKRITDVLQSCATQLREKSSSTLVDVKELLRDCICNSAGRVQSRYSDGARYLRRIKILSELFMDKIVIGEAFQKVLLEKIIQLYTEKEDQGLFMTKQWTVSEACSRDSLQQGGTFQKTLWLTLKNRVSRLIAYIISIADKQNNLDLLMSEKNPWKVEMWMSIYSDLVFSWATIGQAQAFTVTEPLHHKATVPCQIPFSFLLHQFLIDQWNTLKEQNSPNMEKVFFSLYRKSKFCDVIKKAVPSCGGNKFMALYATDLVQYLYIANSGHCDEVALVSDTIHQLSIQRFKRLRNDKTLENGDECAIVFFCYQEMSENLAVLSEIFRLFPDLLVNREWIKGIDLRNIHVYAFKELMKTLENMAENLQHSDICLKWKYQALTAKKLFKKLINHVQDQRDRRNINKKWIPIELVHLFLDHMIPNDAENEVFQRYLSIISAKVILLWRYINQNSIKAYEVLKITLRVLRQVHDELKMKLLINWQDSKCMICHLVMKNPTRLSCGHCYCNDCIRRLVMVTEAACKCPKCGRIIPSGRDLVESQLDDEQQIEMRHFRSNCTSFFMEYLDRFCFGFEEEMPADVIDKIIDGLVSQVVLESGKENEIDVTGIDLNVNSKTCVLRILLYSHPNRTKTLLDEKILQLTKNEMENVVCIIMKCFEDRVLLNVSNKTMGRVEILEYWLNIFKLSFEKLQPDVEYKGLKVDLLETIAEMRCCLTEAASCINDIFKKKELDDDINAKTDMFLSYLIRLCESDEVGVATLKDYLIKSAYHVFGSDWFYQLKSNPNLEDLVPASLIKSDKNDKTDRWVLLGQPYISEVTRIYKMAETNHKSAIAGVFRCDVDEYKKMLAAITVIYDKEDDEIQQFSDIMTINMTSKCQFLKFLTKLFSEFIPMLKTYEDLTELQVHTLVQLTTLIVYISTIGHPAMTSFGRLLSSPRSAENLFLPGMPESAVFSIPEDMRTDHNSMMYQCPNGHLYAVGECRQPMEKGRCPDCGATIGGINHRAVSGNVRFKHQTESSQAGYLLNIQTNSVVLDASDRISKQGAAVVQFLLHSCMLVGLQNDPITIKRMVHASTKEGALQYLVKQMLLNMDALSNALGRNMDETILVLFNIILKLTEKEGGPTMPEWSSIKNRKEWENTFREQYLSPVFQNLDQIITNSTDVITNAEKQNVKALYRLAHELTPTGRAGKSDFKWTDRLFWLYIRRSEASHLLQVLEDSWDVEQSIVKIIIETPDLGLLKYMESVLLLQSALIDKYQNEIDMDDAEKITLKNFESDGGQPCRKYMDDYIAVWNKLCPKLRAKYSFHPRIIEYLEPISILSPISAALPSSRGKGQCAKLLAEHLIDIQNDFLGRCKQVMKADDTIQESKVSQLYHSDYVQIDAHADLLPLLQMHTKYDITRDERGRHHHILYNINALEKQVRDNFVMYKKLIAKQSLPLMQFPQDVGIGNDWDKVLENTQQVVLPGRVAQDLDQLVSGVTSADVCEGVRTLAQAISFLSKVECDGKRNIVEFLEKDLILPSNCIPKSAQIEHTLSLYNRLSWHKAVSFTTRGLNPYKEATASGDQKTIKSKVLLGQIKEAFEHTDVIILQQKLNEVLIKKPDFSPDWSLKDIFPYYDFLGDNGDDDAWYDRLPEKVCFKHTCHLFTLAVRYARDAHH